MIIRVISVKFLTPINVPLSTITTNIVSAINECPNNVAQHLTDERPPEETNSQRSNKNEPHK